MKSNQCSGQIIAGLLLASAIAAQAVTFSDFESTTYNAGQNLVGQDSWQVFFSGPNANRVTPDTGGTGITAVLDGSQSALLKGGSTIGYVGKLWDTASQNIILNDPTGFSVCWLTKFTPDPANPNSNKINGSAMLFLTDAFSAYSTRTGIQFINNNDNGTGELKVGINAGEIDTGFSFPINHLLRLTLEMPKVGGSYSSADAYVYDVTAGGPLTFLGNYPFAAGSISPADFVSDGGVVLSVNSVSGWGVTALFDDIIVLDGLDTVVPEPSVFALLGLGGLFLAWRRKVVAKRA